jgi:long-chain fatty acid transport protein
MFAPSACLSIRTTYQASTEKAVGIGSYPSRRSASADPKEHQMTLHHHLFGVAALTAAGLACMAPTSVHAAGGLNNLETGARDFGLAAAGYAARAEDATTAFTNPAGMVRIKGDDLVLGAQLLYGNLEFSPNGNTTVQGSDGGNAVGWFPGASAFYVHSLSDDVKLGIGMVGNFGLMAEWDKDWVGRYYGQSEDLVGLTIMPSVAFKVNEELSLGFGLNAMLGYLNSTTYINNVLPLGSTADGRVKLKDTDWGFGGTASVLYQPTAQTRFGATYTSRIKLDFKDRPGFSNLGTIGSDLQARGLLSNTVDLGVTAPQSVMTSAYHELASDPRWAVMGNLGWTDWSNFGKVDVGLSTDPPRSLTTKTKYDDTWHAAFGAQYKYTDAWRLTGGVAYDSSPVSNSDRSPILPMASIWTFGLGAVNKVRDGFEVTYAYSLKWSGNVSVDQDRGPLAGRVAGDYENVAVQFFAVSLRWSF